MADLEQLRAFPLAPPATNDIDFPLRAVLNALFYAFSSGINAVTLPCLIFLFIRLPLGSRGFSKYIIKSIMKHNSMIKVVYNQIAMKL